MSPERPLVTPKRAPVEGNAREGALVVHVPIRTISEANRSWVENRWVRRKRVDGQHEAVTLALRARSTRCPWSPPLLVTVTRLGPGRLDPHDNLPTSQKHVIDAIAAYLGIDDRHDHVVRYVIAQERAPEWGVRIRIEPVERLP